MSSPSPPLSPLRALLLVAGFAASAGLAVAVIAFARGGPALSSGAPDAGLERDAGATPPGAAPGLRASPQRRHAEVLEPPRLPEEDLWAMVPDDAGLREIRLWEFEVQGGASTPGTDPEGARREVGEPGWARRAEAELRRGLDELVLGPGVEARRVDCDQGRCLVELGFDTMETGLGRVDEIRRWLTERVPCRAFTDGPIEEESPQLTPDQQIWVLCGQP